MKSTYSYIVFFILTLGMTGCDQGSKTTQQGKVFESSFESSKNYGNPFMDVQVDVLFEKDGKSWRVPAFWAGGKVWKVRFAPPETGSYLYRVLSSDKSNKSLNGENKSLTVTAYTGENMLYKHGMIGISEDKRHFAHADGTPFFWLGDTWWKCLCKRMTWEGFQELTLDRKAKGFSVVQIVCGPYPDEGFLKPSLENEGGLPYLNREFTKVNPKYFDYADRRLKFMVDAGIVPAIVGAWGRSDCNSMQVLGVEGLSGIGDTLWQGTALLRFSGSCRRDPDSTKWGQGAWAEVARYVRSIDPYHHPLTCHTGRSRQVVSGGDMVIDFTWWAEVTTKKVPSLPKRLPYSPRLAI